MSTAQNQLKKWLISQEPTKLQYFLKEKHVLKNFLTDTDREYIEEDLKSRFSGNEQIIRRYIQKALDQVKPFVLYTMGQFQAINEEIFTINGFAFSSPEICRILKSSEFIFPHIISTGKEIEDYALYQTDSLHQQIIKEVCNRTNAIGQSILIENLSNEYGINQILPILPGEPGWERQQGIRIFEIFGSLPGEMGLTITRKGMTNIAYTSYGLIVAD